MRRLGQRQRELLEGIGPHGEISAEGFLYPWYRRPAERLCELGLLERTTRQESYGANRRYVYRLTPEGRAAISDAERDAA